MKKSIFRWSAAVLVAASLGLALSGCGAKDKNSFLIRKSIYQQGRENSQN